MQENSKNNEVLKNFIVAKIEKVRNSHRFGTQKVFLCDRMLHKNEFIFMADKIDNRALVGPRAWEFKIGDVVRAYLVGTFVPPDGKSELRMWLPVEVSQSVRDLVLSKNVEIIDGEVFRLSTDGELISSDYSASVAQKGQRWECTAIAIINDRVVWYPWRMMKTVVATPRKNSDGRIYFSVREISGEIAVSDTVDISPDIETDIISDTPERTIIRERYHYPVASFKDGVPVMAGFVEREVKYEKGLESDDKDLDYIPMGASSAHFSGFHMESEGQECSDSLGGEV